MFNNIHKTVIYNNLHFFYSRCKNIPDGYSRIKTYQKAEFVYRVNIMYREMILYDRYTICVM